MARGYDEGFSNFFRGIYYFAKDLFVTRDEKPRWGSVIGLVIGAGLGLALPGASLIAPLLGGLIGMMAGSTVDIIDGATARKPPENNAIQADEHAQLGQVVERAAQPAQETGRTERRPAPPADRSLSR